MLSQQQRENLKPQLRVMQIIVAALVGGAGIFLAVVLFIVAQDKRGPADDSLFTYVAAANAVFAVVASLFAPLVIGPQLRQTIVNRGQASDSLTDDLDAADTADIGGLANVFQTMTIIRCALLEGAVFLANVAYLLERHTLALIIAGLLIILLVAQIPTMSRLESWIERELAGLKQLRHMR